MRDPGLNAAIQAVGGVSELARRVGISQPSVSNWDKVPAERVIAVEAATGVPRVRLRPDLYREPPAANVDEVDLARSHEYALLSALLARAPEGAQERLFDKHMAPWIGRFFADLERAEAADFYRPVGTLGRVFIEIETKAFALPG